MVKGFYWGRGIGEKEEGGWNMILYVWALVSLRMNILASWEAEVQQNLWKVFPLDTHKERMGWKWRESPYSVRSCAMCARVCLVTQSCPTLCNPVDGSPPGSSVRGVSQTRVLEWIVISFSRESSQPRDWTCVSSVSCIATGFFAHEPSEKPNEEGTNGVCEFRQSTYQCSP